MLQYRLIKAFLQTQSYFWIHGNDRLVQPERWSADGVMTQEMPSSKLLGSIGWQQLNDDFSQRPSTQRPNSVHQCSFWRISQKNRIHIQRRVTCYHSGCDVAATPTPPPKIMQAPASQRLQISNYGPWHA